MKVVICSGCPCTGYSLSLGAICKITEKGIISNYAAFYCTPENECPVEKIIMKTAEPFIPRTEEIAYE